MVVESSLGKPTISKSLPRYVDNDSAWDAGLRDGDLYVDAGGCVQAVYKPWRVVCRPDRLKSLRR